LTAIGLALNPLKVPCPNIKTNLIPDHIKESMAAKRELLVFVNAVVGILLAISIFAGFAASQFTRTEKTVQERKAKTPLKLIEMLVLKQKEITKEVAVLSEKKELVDKVLEKTAFIDWSAGVEEIRRNVPASLYITIVDTYGDFGLVIKGKALAPDAVNLFSGNLDKSELFESSNVKVIEKKNSKDGMVDYTVKCTIADNRRLYAEAN
jgi:Tfp pilus assembly protein PilN